MIGIQTVHRARHLFREHCSATPEPMSHLRMGGMHRRFIGGTAGQSGWVSNFPAGATSRNPPGLARCSQLVLGFRAGLNQPREKPLVTPPIGIDAPFTVTSETARSRSSSSVTR